MNVTQAMTRLRKLLGPKAGIRDSGHATSPEQRAQERALRTERRVLRDAAEAARTARRAEILAADPEYQRLKAAHKAASDAFDQTHGVPQYRYTAGTIGALFFSQVAEADNLAELIANVEAKLEERAS